jgi:hypothetical protein
MVMIIDENGDDSVSVSTYSQKQMPIQIQAKSTSRLLLRTVTEESKAQK